MARTIEARWKTAVLVCGKCSRKVGGGFGPGGDKRLAKALRKRIGGKGRKAEVGIVETPCLKLCPKNAVVALNTARPNEWLLVKPGTPIDEVADRLGL